MQGTCRAPHLIYLPTYLPRGPKDDADGIWAEEMQLHNEVGTSNSPSH